VPVVTAWLLDPEVLHLNHGSFGATPAAVLDYQQTIRTHIEANPTRFFLEGEYQDSLDEVRRIVARFHSNHRSSDFPAHANGNPIHTHTNQYTATPCADIHHGRRCSADALRIAKCLTGATHHAASVSHPDRTF